MSATTVMAIRRVPSESLIDSTRTPLHAPERCNFFAIAEQSLGRCHQFACSSLTASETLPNRDTRFRSVRIWMRNGYSKLAQLRDM